MRCYRKMGFDLKKFPFDSKFVSLYNLMSKFVSDNFPPSPLQNWRKNI